VLGRFHGQDRTGRAAHDFFRDAAHEEALQAGAAVGGHDDQPAAGFLRDADDLRGLVALGELVFDADRWVSGLDLP
jgi:hypothetical protein